MKRLTSYFLYFIGLCVFFTACYYISFQNALNQFNTKAVERDHRLLSSLEEYKKQQKLLYANSEYDKIGETENNVIPADTTEEDIVLPGTKYILETYQVTTNTLLREELVPTSDLIGLTRSEIILKLGSYMKNVPVSELDKGLLSYELLTFSTKELLIRKTYNEDLVTFKYYVAVKNGKVIVLYSDLVTVYEYTNIEAILLPEKDRMELMEGIYIVTTEELFSLLESYSS